MSDRDTTVAGLIAKLHELIKLNPAIATYQVVMEGHDCGVASWRGSCFQWPDDDPPQLELETYS